MSGVSWKKISESSEQVGYRRIVTKNFIMPDGQPADFTIWNQSDVHCACTVAVTKDGLIVIARQYRPGPERILDELPGGLVEPGEDYALAAARELAEETGYVSDEPLLSIGSSVKDAYSNAMNHYFLARNCYSAAEQQLDATEFVEVDTISREQLVTNAKNGSMTDAEAVLMAYDYLFPPKS